MIPPPFYAEDGSCLHILSHVEDIASPSFWNTPFRVKINFNGQVLEATLDTRASLSAVRADIVQSHPKLKANIKLWTTSPILLADGSTCDPVGVTWLNFGFMGEGFYQRFAVVTHLPSRLVLGMDFMQQASVTIHIPSRTVIVGNNPLIADEMEGSDINDSNSSLFLMDVSSVISQKMDEACLSSMERERMTKMLEIFLMDA